MGEALVELGGKQEVGINLGGLVAPAFADVGPDVSVEAGVDLTAIKELRQVFKRVNLALLQVRWIDDAFPVFVREAGGADVNRHSKKIRSCWGNREIGASGHRVIGLSEHGEIGLAYKVNNRLGALIGSRIAVPRLSAEC